MPDAILHYKVLAPLGVGGLGEVYRARDTNLGRTVAVKVLPRSITGDPALFDALDRQRARGLVLTGLNANVPLELEQTIGRMLFAIAVGVLVVAAALAAWWMQ